MPVVIDTSAVIALVLDDEPSDYAEAVADRVLAEGGLVPSLFWYEVRNALLASERRGRITSEQIEVFLKDLEAQPILVDRFLDTQAVLDLARRRQLSVYDSAYLEIAIRTKCPFATLDKRLAEAAKAEGVEVIQ